MQPINYSTNVVSPIQKALAAQQQNTQNELQRQQLGLSSRQVTLAEDQFGYKKDQNAKAEEALATQAQAAKDKLVKIQQFGSKPNKTAEDYSNAIIEHPELAEQFTKAYNLIDEAEQQSTSTELTQAYAAIHSGNPQIAEDMVRRRMEAAKNSGDEKEYRSSKATLEILKSNPEGAKTAIGLQLAAVSGPEKFAQTLKAVGDFQTDEQLRDGKVRKQNSEIASIGLKNGLTEQQVRKTIAETSKLSADTSKVIMEIKSTNQGGVIPDPEKRFNVEQKLRKEYNAEVGTFTETQDAYNRVQSAEKTAVGDIALITSYMKMIDPGSVVREGEFANAQNAAGAGAKFRNTYNRILSGERLSEGQRVDFKSQARSLLEGAKKREQEVRKGLAPTIKEYGLSEDNIFYTGEGDGGATGGGGQGDLPTGFVLD